MALLDRALFVTAVTWSICLVMVSASGVDDDPVGGGIQVIGAGLGRTGTLSLTAALEQVGFRPYHYIDFSHSEKWERWSKFMLDSNELVDLIVRDGYNATVENPTSDMYMDIMAKYPKAKVVLTVRDNPLRWAKSWKVLFDTMIVTEHGFTLTFPSFFQFIPLFRHLKSLRCRMGMHLGLQRCDLTHNWRNLEDGEQWLIQQYHAHNNQVIDNVPDHQLLVFNVKEGWEPLCKFLDLSVPTDDKGQPLPFPNASTGINDTQSLKKLRNIFLVVIYLWIPFLLLLTFLLGIYAMRIFKRKVAKRKSE